MEKSLKNPVYVLTLGSLLALGASGDVSSALVMGVSTLVVLVLTSVIINATKKFFDEDHLLVVSLIVTTALTTLAYMLTAAFANKAYSSIANYLPALAICGLTMLNAKESYLGVSEASKTGLTFLVAVVVMGAVRELLAFGTIAGASVLPASMKIAAMGKAPGAFLALGLSMAIINALTNKKEAK